MLYVLFGFAVFCFYYLFVFMSHFVLCSRHTTLCTCMFIVLFYVVVSLS